MSIEEKAKLADWIPPRLLACATPAETKAFETRPLSDASGGFVSSKLNSGHCGLVGDAAVSPAPAGQGINHALDQVRALLSWFPLVMRFP